MTSGRGTHRSRFITALDLLLIVSLSIALVMLLGVTGRFTLAWTSVSIRDPLRPLVLAAVVGFVRFKAGRGLPLLPSILPAAVRERLDVERARIAAPAAATRTVKYYALAAAVASLTWVTPHLANVRLVPDPYDPLFSAWRLARVVHQLTNDPAHLFDGNIFHPARQTLTYSDPTFLQGLVALPFITSGVDPLVVSNGIFLATFPFCALAFFYAAWRLTDDPQAGCIAGILGGLSAFKIEHYSHLELQFLGFGPLAVWALLRMFAAPSLRTGVWFGLALTAQWLSCMYLAVMLGLFLSTAAVFVVAAWQIRPTKALAAAVAAGALVVVAGGSITAVPFLRSQEHRGERLLDLVGYYSATPGDYADRTRRLATYEDIGSREHNNPERELFPGTLPIALGALGLTPPVSAATIALTAATAVAFESSLGTNGLLYRHLYKYVLPIRGMRVPARFGALVAMGLVLLSAYGVKRVLRLGRTRTARTTIFAVLAAGALIDLRADVLLVSVPETVPSIYGAVTKDMVLAEVPMEEHSSFSYMYFSTAHWGRLINGHSGYFPPTYHTLEEEMRAFPTQAALELLRAQGATHVTVNCRLFRTPGKCPGVLAALDAMPDLEVISQTKWEGAEVRLYALTKEPGTGRRR